MGILFFFAYFIAVSQAQADSWFDENFDELIRTRDAIFRACPPVDCIYVGIGASPTPVMAVLEASVDASSAGETFIHIPVSGMQNYFSNDAKSSRKIIAARFDAVFDAYLPSEVINNKRILLLDVSSFQGRSIAGVYDELNRYVQERRIFAHIEGDVLSNSLYWKTSKLLSVRKIRNLKVSFTRDLLIGEIRDTFRRFTRLSITNLDPGFQYRVQVARPAAEEAYQAAITHLRERVTSYTGPITRIEIFNTSQIEMRTTCPNMFGKFAQIIKSLLSK